MKIRNRLLINNLSVGLIPILLIFSIMFSGFQRRIKESVAQTLDGSLENFRLNLENKIDTSKNFSMLMSRYVETYINDNSGQFGMAEQWDIFSVSKYGIDIYEVFQNTNAVYRDISSWEKHRYQTSTETAGLIWDELMKPDYHSYYAFSYPETVSNDLIIRSCAVINHPGDNRKIGFTVIAVPFDKDFMNQIALSGGDTIYFIKHDAGMVISSPAFDQETEIVENYPEDGKIDVLRFSGLGKYYLMRKNLLTKTVVNDTGTNRVTADIGILYDFKAANREFLLFKTVWFSVLGLSILGVTLAAGILSKRMTSPIIKMNQAVAEFERDMVPVSVIGHGPKEIIELSENIHRMSKTLIDYTDQLEKEHHKLKIQNEKMQEEFRMARQIQKHLIPGKIARKDIAYFYQPMYEVGGDFFDFYAPSTDDAKAKKKLGVFISDVSGHGISAAIITSMIKSFAAKSMEYLNDPAEYLYHLNQFLTELISENFVTAFYGIIDLERREMTYSSAAHNPPYILDMDQIRVLDYRESGFPLGVMDNDFMKRRGLGYENHTCRFEPDSKLFLYTDGLTEAMPSHIQATGRDDDFRSLRLTECLDKYQELEPDQFIQKMIAELKEFRGEENFDDDVCIVCIQIT